MRRTPIGWMLLLVAWLVLATAARAQEPATPAEPAPTEIGEPPASIDKVFMVATKPFKPFVFKQNGAWVGFSIDLWRALATDLGWTYELYGTETVPALLDEVQEGRADFAVAGLTITSQREEKVDFSYSFFQSGLQILVPASGEATAADVVLAIFNPELLKLVGFLLAVLLVAAHVIWFLERETNPDFPRGYAEGIWEAFWWASVTITTVGYGDKVPRNRIGRMVALVWMFSGIVLIAYFTASVTTVLTVQQLQGNIAGPSDLPGKKVGTVRDTTAHRWLVAHDVKVTLYDRVEDALGALRTYEVEAVVYDAPVLLFYAAHEGRGQVKLAGPVFAQQSYGIAMPPNSPWREELNYALLRAQEDGTYAELYTKWFGGS